MVIDNIKKILQEIKEKFPNGNKFKENITIVAATKNVGADVLKQLESLGIGICGENRVQEFLTKYDKLKTEWHFIGNLQTNKVKYIVNKVSLIQSVNSLKLAKEIDRQSLKINKISDILVEVNVANEESKNGIDVNGLESFLAGCKELKNIRVLGLMAIMPYTENIIENKNYYLQMREIYDRIKEKNIFNFKYLSMGMSNDYITAIECGSNMIRLGTVLFGHRQINDEIN